MSYLFINTSGKVVKTTNTEPTLEELQSFVGGRIEGVNMLNHRFYCNEEGRLLNLEENIMFPRLFGNIVCCCDVKEVKKLALALL